MSAHIHVHCVLGAHACGHTVCCSSSRCTSLSSAEMAGPFPARPWSSKPSLFGIEAGPGCSRGHCCCATCAPSSPELVPILLRCSSFSWSRSNPQELRIRCPRRSQALQVVCCTGCGKAFSVETSSQALLTLAQLTVAPGSCSATYRRLPSPMFCSV